MAALSLNRWEGYPRKRHSPPEWRRQKTAPRFRFLRCFFHPRSVNRPSRNQRPAPAGGTSPTLPVKNTCPIPRQPLSRNPSCQIVVLDSFCCFFDIKRCLLFQLLVVQVLIPGVITGGSFICLFQRRWPDIITSPPLQDLLLTIF
jgi:hypothetical protein